MLRAEAHQDELRQQLQDDGDDAEAADMRIGEDCGQLCPVAMGCSYPVGYVAKAIEMERSGNGDPGDQAEQGGHPGINEEANRHDGGDGETDDDPRRRKPADRSGEVLFLRAHMRKRQAGHELQGEDEASHVTSPVICAPGLSPGQTRRLSKAP